jgi:hypothetical protein
VSAKERIGRLQDLLERVQTRAAAPRPNGAHAFAGEAQREEAAPLTPPMHQMAAEQARTKAAYESEHPAADPYDMETDVEVSSEVVEVDIDIDEPTAMESGAQPIANPTMPPDELEEVIEEAPNTTSNGPNAHDEEPTHAKMASPANEIEEPTPSSSRRPIAGEEVSGTYEEESAPRHTPPPESGKQVAAPSVHPPSRKPSAPPPSLEGHTLIGGWREPGLGGTPQFSVEPRGGAPARVPGQGGQGPGTEPPATLVQPQAAPQASGPRLTADVTRPALGASLGASANVATFTGAAPVAKPATLGELLDLTLGL